MALTQISTQGIKDGTITNADINASAAIAGSKISPNFTSAMDVDGSITCDDIITAGALLHEGDTDTLVHFSAANTIELKTGGVSRLLVNNFGISLNKDLNTNGNRIIVGDSSGSSDDRIVLGNNNDLEIYHDGTNSVLTNSTGNLQIKSTSELLLQSDAGETMVRGVPNNTVELRYDNVKKFETTTYGVKVTGRLAATTSFTGSDNVKLILGDSDDLQIYHDGSHSYIQDTGTGELRFTSNTYKFYNAAFSETLIEAFENGAVNLYYDGSKKIETTANGVEVTGSIFLAGKIDMGDSSSTTTGRILLGTGDDLQIYHDGVDNHIDASQTLSIKMGGETSAQFDVNGAVHLYYDNSKKFETTSIGVTVTGAINASSNVTLSGGSFSTPGNLDLGDSSGTASGRVLLGASDDLQIYHDGSNSYIQDSGSGGLFIQGSGGGAGITLEDPDGNDFIKCIDEGTGGAVELYKAGTKRLETTTSGVTVTGKITTSGGSSGSTVFNEDGADVDFRIEGDTQASLFKVDAGNDRVGIGESDPTVVFHATQFNHAFADSTSSLATVPTKSVARFRGSNNASGSLFIGNESTAAKCYLQGCNETGNGSIDILLNPFGANVGIGTTSPGRTLDVNGIIRSDGTSSGLAIGGNSSTPSEGVAIHRPATHTMAFVTDSSERMRIDSSGRVGIGTSNPSVTLDIEATTPTIRLTDSDASGTPESEIQGGGGDLVFSADRDDENSSTIIGFKVDGSERMRISSNGGLFLGLTGNVNSSTGMTCFRNISDNRRELMLGTTSTGNRGLVEFFNPNGGVGSINTTGSETQYNTNSDYRLKENVVAISDGITRLKTLKPSRFNFKADANKTVDGFLAHEVTAVPEAITGEKDAVVTQALVDSGEKEESELGDPVYQQIDQSKLVPLLVAAVQESISKIEVLETEVAALKAA